jgi:hypothetical protein
MSRCPLLATLIAWFSCSAGCGAQSGAGSDGAACSTVAAAPQSRLPHVTASGANATAITQALDAIFASQTPPVAPGEPYALQKMDCVDLDVPTGPSGYECSLQVEADGGQPIAVTVNPPSVLAQNLFNALTAAGSTTCVDPHGVRVMLENVTVSTNDVQFDDASNYESFPAPTCRITRRGLQERRIVARVYKRDPPDEPETQVGPSTPA